MDQVADRAHGRAVALWGERCFRDRSSLGIDPAYPEVSAVLPCHGPPVTPKDIHFELAEGKKRCFGTCRIANPKRINVRVRDFVPVWGEEAVRRGVVCRLRPRPGGDARVIAVDQAPLHPYRGGVAQKHRHDVDGVGMVLDEIGEEPHRGMPGFTDVTAGDRLA